MTLDAGPMCPYCFKRGVHLATCLAYGVTVTHIAGPNPSISVQPRWPQSKDKP